MSTSRRRTAPGRVALQVAAALVFVVLFVIPLATVVCAALFRQWSGPIPTGFTWSALTAVISDPDLARSIWVSVATAIVATMVTLVVALATALLGRASRWQRALYGFIAAAPLTVPTVAIGLAVLMTFSAPPFAINGTPWIVVLGHFFLLLPLGYQPIVAAVSGLSPDLEEISSLLGASRLRTVTRVVLPQLRPGLVAAASICIATSMGELTISMMVAPPEWQNMPLTIFGLTSRGIRTGQGAALTIILLLITVAILLAIRPLAGSQLPGQPERRASRQHLPPAKPEQRTEK